MKTHAVDQNTDEWYACRLGRLTASKATTIRANGKGLETYCMELSLERITGRSQDTFEGTVHTRRGHELEDLAVTVYEMEYEDTRPVGFVELDEWVGCSPDRLVGEKGLLEVKCPSDKVMFEYVLGVKDPIKKYQDQCQMQMYVTGREWCDLFLFNEQLGVQRHRIERDEKHIEKIKKGIETAKKLIQDLCKKFMQGKEKK